jgi:hypothetical protein
MKLPCVAESEKVEPVAHFSWRRFEAVRDLCVLRVFRRVSVQCSFAFLRRKKMLPQARD